MVKALAYFFAIIITIMLAVFLYPISAIFWVFGLFGKIADIMFAWTRNRIRSIWAELKDMDGSGASQQQVITYNIPPQSSARNEEEWLCNNCGNVSRGKFCTKCGVQRQ